MLGPSITTRGRELRLAGGLLFLAGGLILMGIITAEALYPAPYTTHGNDISDLGGTRPPDSVILQPSATIFDASMMAVGLLVLVAVIPVHRALGRRSVTIPLAVLGAAALGVGVFPGNTGNPHAISALATFISGGVVALTTARVVGAPFSWLSTLLGALALLTLVSYLAFGESGPLRDLGTGGLERWIVYPIVIWIIGFGGYLAGAGAGVRTWDAGRLRGP
jgi:hypothetical membrane protein